jgi:anaerobic magnesium-protoporphyrin IX monomethyl ester cyclase
MVTMKIYLLNPPFIHGFSRGVRGVGEATRGGTLYLPICLSYATGLLEISHEVRLIDAQALNWSIESVLKDVTNFKPDLLVVDTNFSSLNNDLKVTTKLKEACGVISVIVGPPASQYPEKILSYGIDIVARYEYDFTLKEIAHNIENCRSLNDIEGISYKINGKVINNPDRKLTSSEDLDKIPFVSKVYKNHLNINDYFLSSSFYPMVQIFTGRGCPNKCSFCSWPKTLMGTKYRSRSIDDILNEFEYIEKEFPAIKEIVIEDDTFTVNQKRVLEFCEKYLQRNLNIVWSCNARATLDYETMKKMKKANCRLLICGYESGSEDILKNINKGITINQIKNFSYNARKSGLLVHGDFIIGLPGETKETIEMTKKIIDDLKADILQVLIPQPIPGTDLYNWCANNGYLISEDPNEYLDEYGYQKSIVSYPHLSNECIKSEADLILKKYYLSSHYVPIAFRQIFRKNGFSEAKRLFYSAKMFIKYAKEDFIAQN